MNKRQKKKNKETLILFGSKHIYIPRGEWRRIYRKGGKYAGILYAFEKEDRKRHARDESRNVPRRF